MPKKFTTFKKFAKTFKKRKFTNKRRKFRKKGKGPSTSTQKNAIMSDRTFVTFPYVTLSNGRAPNSTTAQAYTHATDSYGLLPFTTGATYLNPFQTATQFVFFPQWSVTTGVLNWMHMLPGNALTMLSQSQTAGGGLFYSDIYHTAIPTGVKQWSAFYNQYICHGSSIEVTLLSVEDPGQLVVLPVCTNVAKPAEGDAGEYGYDFNPTGTVGTNATPINIYNLLTSTSLPDDQPHVKVKTVSAAGGMDKVVVRHKILTKQLYDVKVLRDDDANKASMYPAGITAGTFGGFEPTANQWVWYIAYIPSAGQAATSNNNSIGAIQVKVKYLCELTDRVNITNTITN